MNLRMMIGFLPQIVLLALASVCSGHDGPYVLRAPGGGWQVLSVESGPQGLRRRESLPTDEPVITVNAVGGQPSFRVRLSEAATAPDDLKIPAKSRLFVVADTHGEYEILARQLREHGVVDASLSWSFGRGHLVVLGDVFDRGPRHTEILWLLYKLEAEAAKAGGGTHLVLGNHEVMILGGDLRYLHPRYLDTARALGVHAYSELFAADTALGSWLRARPTLLRINDQLFLHGGVSRALADSGQSLSEINAQLRAILSGSRPVTPDERRRAQLLLGSLGPLWYRGYFESRSSPRANDEDVDQVLRVFGVRRIFVGHTVVPEITALYGGKVIAVQVYPKLEQDGDIQFESLSIRNGVMWRALPGGRTRRLETPAIR